MDQDQGGSSRNPASAPCGEFLLELRLDVPEAPVGEIRRRAGSPARRFHGWLELMVLLDQLRSEATSGQPPPAGEPTAHPTPEGESEEPPAITPLRFSPPGGGGRPEA